MPETYIPYTDGVAYHIMKWWNQIGQYKLYATFGNTMDQHQVLGLLREMGEVNAHSS